MSTFQCATLLRCEIANEFPLQLNILIPPLPGKIWQIYARFNNQSAAALHILNITNCKFFQSISCLLNRDCVLRSQYIVVTNISKKKIHFKERKKKTFYLQFFKPENVLFNTKFE